MKETVQFKLKVIPLEEARMLSYAGSGNYSEMKAELLYRIPRLKSDEAFSFNMPDESEKSESQRRGVCISLNTTFAHAKLRWRVTYSSTARCFVVLPKNDMHARPLMIAKSAGVASKPKEFDRALEIASKLWGIGKSILLEKNGKHRYTPQRSALKYVARKDLNIRMKEIAKIYDCSHTSIFGSIRRIKPKGLFAVGQLRAALKQGGMHGIK